MPTAAEKRKKTATEPQPESFGSAQSAVTCFKHSSTLNRGRTDRQVVTKKQQKAVFQGEKRLSVVLLECSLPVAESQAFSNVFQQLTADYCSTVKEPLHKLACVCSVLCVSVQGGLRNKGFFLCEKTNAAMARTAPNLNILHLFQGLMKNHRFRCCSLLTDISLPARLRLEINHFS